MAGSQRSCGRRPLAADPPPQHTKRNHAAASVLIALEASHDVMIQSAASCVRVAPLGSRAEAQHSRVPEKHVGLVSCALHTPAFGRRLRSTRCTAKVLRRTVSAYLCNLHLVLVYGHHNSAERKLTAISACCSQADTAAPAHSPNNLPVAMDICCTLAHGATSHDAQFINSPDVTHVSGK